jgi:hypothetical protein
MGGEKIIYDFFETRTSGDFWISGYVRSEEINAVCDGGCVHVFTIMAGAVFM